MLFHNPIKTNAMLPLYDDGRHHVAHASILLFLH
jgi:hypothetical protein